MGSAPGQLLRLDVDLRPQNLTPKAHAQNSVIFPSAVHAGTYKVLSATGAFSDLANLTPQVGIISYEPNVPFWSDYAVKSRWFSIKNPSVAVGFSAEANWSFPAGMVWIKHFDIETTRGNPATRRKLETRFLVKTATDRYGLVYNPPRRGGVIRVARNAAPVTHRWPGSR